MHLSAAAASAAFAAVGDLAALLRVHKTFSEEVARFVAVEVLLGLQQLQIHRVVYRDLKAANILIDLDGHCRLADFGLAKRLTGMHTTDMQQQQLLRMQLVQQEQQ